MPFSYLTAWRVVVLLLLAAVVGELAITNRNLAVIGNNTTASAETASEVAGLGEKPWVPSPPPDPRSAQRIAGTSNRAFSQVLFRVVGRSMVP